MMLTYDEFIKLIPEETKKYIKTVLIYLNYYIKENNSIASKSNIYNFETNTHININENTLYKSKLLLSALIGFSLNEKLHSSVEIYDFNYSKIKFIKTLAPTFTEKDEKELFNQCNELFYIYDDYTKYTTLLPEDILANAFKLSSNNNLLNYFKIKNNIKNDIKKQADNKHANLDIEKEITLYKNLPYETIQYIETASKIRSILIKKLKTTNELRENDYIKIDDKYLIPISLLLAIYEYDGEQKNNIENYLIMKNITLSKIYEKIGQTLTSFIKITPRNIESIEMIYKQYWTNGINKDKPLQDIHIINIVNNLLDRNFTQSIILEKILNKFTPTTLDFSKITEEITLYENLNKNSKINSEINSFYSKIKKDTKELSQLA